MSNPTVDITHLSIEDQLEYLDQNDLAGEIIDQNLLSVVSGADGRSVHLYSCSDLDLLLHSQTAHRATHYFDMG